jgi:ATP dependent DNA ligase-like protein
LTTNDIRNIINFDPRKQAAGDRHQIGMLAGFRSEWAVGFVLECMAGFVGIRTQLLELLCDWWQVGRPRGWLFPGLDPVNPMSARQLCRAVSAVARAAGIASACRRTRCGTASPRTCSYRTSISGSSKFCSVTPDGRLLYAGRVGTGMSEKTLRMLHGRLARLATSKMPLAEAPPRKTRFGGTLALSKVHWTEPQLVAEITYLTWGDEGLLRHTVFVGLREDKSAREVRRETA